MFYWEKNEVASILGALIIVIIATIFFYRILKNKRESIQKIPFILITIILWVLEIIKQIYFLIRGYVLTALPFHICSLFLFLYPLVLVKNKKVQRFAKTMIFVYSIWLLVMFYMHPSTIIGNAGVQVFASFETFHTFFYHYLVIFYFLLGMSLRLFDGLDKLSYLHVVIGFGIYGMVVIPVSHILNVNFANVLYNEFAAFDVVRTTYGIVVYTAILFMVAVFISMFMIYVFLQILKLKRKKQVLVS